jgi:hypothetical protein
MSDEVIEPVEEIEAEEEPWVPGPSLHGPLLGGALATLMTAGLAVGSSVLEFQQVNPQGFTLAQALGWAALVPGILVARTFYLLAQESQSFSLQKSSLCLFGTLVLFQVYELASLHILPEGGQIALWAVIVLGLLALVGALFVHPGKAEEKAKKPLPIEAASGAKNNKKGLLGGLAVAVFVILKLVGKGLLGKILIFRGIGKLLNNVNNANWEPAAITGLLLCGGVYLIWFAVSKIRLRGQLGGMAALAGWIELLLLVVGGGVFVSFLLEFFSAMNQPGIKDQDLEELVKTWSQTIFLTEISAIIIWGMMTAFLFLSVRARFKPDWSWQDEPEAYPSTP